MTKYIMIFNLPYNIYLATEMLKVHIIQENSDLLHFINLLNSKRFNQFLKPVNVLGYKWRRSEIPLILANLGLIPIPKSSVLFQIN